MSLRTPWHQSHWSYIQSIYFHQLFTYNFLIFWFVYMILVWKRKISLVHTSIFTCSIHRTQQFSAFKMAYVGLFLQKTKTSRDLPLSSTSRKRYECYCFCYLVIIRKNKVYRWNQAILVFHFTITWQQHIINNVKNVAAVAFFHVEPSMRKCV